MVIYYRQTSIQRQGYRSGGRRHLFHAPVRAHRTPTAGSANRPSRSPFPSAISTFARCPACQCPRYRRRRGRIAIGVHYCGQGHLAILYLRLSLLIFLYNDCVMISIIVFVVWDMLVAFIIPFLCERFCLWKNVTFLNKKQNGSHSLNKAFLS